LNVQFAPNPVVGNYEVQAEIIEKLIYNNIDSQAKGYLPHIST